MIDPSKDKFAYFKDNIQTAEDKEDFDASQYYYHRDDFSNKGLGGSGSLGGSALGGGGLSGSGNNHLNLSAFHSMGLSGALNNDADCNTPPQHGVFGGFNGSGMMSSGTNSFLGSVSRGPLGGGIPNSHELHRMNSGEPMSAVVKGRTFQPSENKAPDMSEFPALGSRMSSMSLDTNSDGSIDSRLRSQPSEFIIQKEDFPALSTFGPSSTEKSAVQDHALKRHSSFTASAADPQRSGGAQTDSSSSIGSRTGGVPGFSFNGSVASTGNNSVNLGGGALGHLHPSKSEQSNINGELDPTNKYGLLGMLHTVIRPSSDAKKNLAMGCDLTSLGLNLNSAEPLHPTFASPWAEGPLTKEPQFSLPVCYYNQPPVLKTTHLSKFHLETLFYIFYSMPKDVLQAYSAQELYSREWRYHAELKTWLKRASAADATLFASGSSTGSGAVTGLGSGTLSSGSVGSIGSAPSSGSTASSIGGVGSSPLGPQFLYFDTTTWERRVFTGNIHSVSTGLMSEEEIRVKFNATS